MIENAKNESLITRLSREFRDAVVTPRRMTKDKTWTRESKRTFSQDLTTPGNRRIKRIIYTS